MIQGPREKDLDEWQQSLPEAENLVDQFSMRGQVVVDPMCGTGTVLVAAKNLDRRYLGFDSDPDKVAIARKRLAPPLPCPDEIP